MVIGYQIDSKKAVASTSNNIGIMYRILGDYVKSIEFFQISLKIKEELNDNVGIVNTLINISKLYYELNKFGVTYN